MKQPSLLIAALLISNQAMSCPSIIGAWKSNKELSMGVNGKNTALPANRIELLNQILGILEITYTKSVIREREAPPIKVRVSGKEHDFHFEKLEYKYELISCSETQVKIKKYYPYGEPYIEVLNMANENTYWVYGTQENKTVEYFVRVKS